MENNNYIIYDLTTSEYKIKQGKLRNLIRSFAELKMKLNDIMQNINREQQKIKDQIIEHADITDALHLLLIEQSKLTDFKQLYNNLIINFEPVFNNLYKQFEEMEDKKRK